MRELDKLMVFSSENNIEKPHLSNPHSTEEDMIPLQNCSESSPPDLKFLSLSVSFDGWRLSNKNFKSWAIKMAALHKPIWEKAGIFEAVMSSTKRIHRNTDLVLGITERWCSDTSSFVFPWGEATITLEDVMLLLGFSVLGLPYSAALNTSGEEKIKEKLVNEWRKMKKDKIQIVTQVTWMRRFMDSGDDELEHVAFLALWLSYFVFPSRYYCLHKDVFTVAVHLSRGTKIALGPAVLANLYRELTLLRNHIRDFTVATITDKIELTSLFKLVQVWTWERFRELQPKPNLKLEGEPRMARWEDSKHQRTSHVREILENSKMDSFEWRPYTKTVLNWKFPQFYPEQAMSVPVDPNLDDEFISFARCIKVCELVGIDCVEHYYPNRVASQFGLLQDVPCHVKPNTNLPKEAAWDEYNKAIDDLTLYIPSRSATPCFTPMFCQWLRKSSPFESAQMFPAELRNIIRDDDTSSSVPKGSKRRKRIRENDETTMVCCQTQFPSENDDEDDNLTIAQTMRLKRKKYRSADNNGRDAFEQLASITADGNGTDESGKAGENTVLSASDESNYSSDLPKVLPLSQVLQKCKMGDCGVTASREVLLERCDDEVEINVEKKVDDGIKEAEFFLQEEDGEKERSYKKVDDGTKEPEFFFQEEDGEKERSNKKEDVNDYAERQKQRRLAIEELALNLEARLVMMEKTLAMIRI